MRSIRWTEDTVDAALRPLVAELGRLPTRAELRERGQEGLYRAMTRLGGVAAWRTRVAPPQPVRADDVAVHAYFLWLNGAPGGPDGHWLAAERELSVA